MLQEHGTAAAELVRQYSEDILVPVVRAVPKATEGIDSKRLKTALRRKSAPLTVGLNKLFIELSRLLPYPPVGEVFELTLDGDDPANDPIEMVRQDGHGESQKWEFRGRRVVGVQIRHFKLVQIGYQPNFEAVLRELGMHGTIPEGQWREAFKVNYETDGKGPVGIADSFWVDPDGDANFPYVSTVGRSLFYWTARAFDDVCWRWLVAVSK